MVVVRGKKYWNNSLVCVLAISLHNPNNSGEAFKETIDLVNHNKGFTRCLIDLSDTLNRHNYMMIDNITEEEAMKKARYHGDRWLDRHGFLLERLNIPHHVIRWDNWRTKPEFKSTLNKFQKAYDESQPLKAAVHSDVSRFYERRGKSIGHIKPIELKHSVDYLLEELACHSIMYENLHAANVYPGREQDCYKLVRSGKVPNVPMGLMNSHHTRLVFHGVKEQKSDLLRENVAA